MAFLIGLEADPEAALATAARAGHGRCLDTCSSKGQKSAPRP